MYVCKIFVLTISKLVLASHQGQTPSRASVNSHNAPHLTSTYPNEKALVLLDTLREQHDQLTTALGRLSSLQLHSQRRSSPVQSRTSEDIATPTASSPALWQAVGGSNIRGSFSSAWSNTDGSSVWFDAIEGDELGVEEFIVQEHDEPEDDESVTGPVAIETELSNSLDKNEESEVEADISIDESLGPPDNSHLNVMRRTRLPAKPVGDEGSLFAVLKKNVGQVRIFTSPKHKWILMAGNSGLVQYSFPCDLQRASDVTPAIRRGVGILFSSR